MSSPRKRTVPPDGCLVRTTTTATTCRATSATPATRSGPPDALEPPDGASAADTPGELPGLVGRRVLHLEGRVPVAGRLGVQTAGDADAVRRRRGASPEGTRRSSAVGSPLTGPGCPASETSVGSWVNGVVAIGVEAPLPVAVGLDLHPLERCRGHPIRARGNPAPGSRRASNRPGRPPHRGVGTGTRWRYRRG